MYTVAPLFITGVGIWELVFLFLVILLLFGAKRLPEIGSSLGKGIREFKGSLREIEGELKLPEEGQGRRSGEDRQHRSEEGREHRPEERREHRPEEGSPSSEDENNGEPHRLTTSQ
jgi:sec-independent protein translocase protein TatA